MEKKVYPAPLRLPIGPQIARKDKYLSIERAKWLLSGRVIVEEKMDGKFAVGDTDNFLLFMEDLKYKHSVYYRVPSRFAVFDVLDKKRGLFLDREEKIEVVDGIRKLAHKARDPEHLFPFVVPLVAKGEFSLEDIPKLITMSVYAIDEETKTPTFMEGVVVKPDRELFFVEFETGKLVRREFEEGIKEHYTKKPKKLNQINPSIPYILTYRESHGARLA